MKQKTMMSTLALVAIFAFTACGGDEYIEDPSFDQEVKTELLDKSELPEWLSGYVSYLECCPEGQKLLGTAAGVYRFKWEGKTYYEIYTSLQSNLHQELYDSNGVPLVLTEEYFKPFSDHVSDWTIIYLIDPTSKAPQDHVYPVEVLDTNGLKFPDKILPKKILCGFYEDSYGCNFAPKASTIFIVNSEEDLKKLYTDTTSIPSFDFDKYTLIVGYVYSPIPSTLKWQKMETHENSIVVSADMHFYFEQKQVVDKVKKYLDNEPIELQKFWSLYPKQTYNYLGCNMDWNNELYSACGIFKPVLPEETRWVYEDASSQLFQYTKEKPGVFIQFPGNHQIMVYKTNKPYQTNVEAYYGTCEMTKIGETFYGGYSQQGNIKITFDDIDVSTISDPDIKDILTQLENMTDFFYGFYQLEMSSLTPELRQIYFYRIMSPY